MMLCKELFVMLFDQGLFLTKYCAMFHYYNAAAQKILACVVGAVITLLILLLGRSIKC